MFSEIDMEEIYLADYLPWEKLYKKSILVTGATGLIGYTLIRMLLLVNEKKNLGVTIMALVRDEEKARERFEGAAGDMTPLRFLRGSVEKLPDIDGQVNYMIHGASQTVSKAFIRQPVETIRTAVLGTVNMLELARRKESEGFVYLSSLEVYGSAQPGGRIPETEGCILYPEDVRGSYPVSKVQCENLCCAYAAEYGVPAMAARLATVFGPDVHPADSRIFAELKQCAEKGQDFILHTAGSAERNYIYAADAASALLTILLKGQPGKIYNVADDRLYGSIAEMAEKIAAANDIRVHCEREDGNGRGYARPTYVNMDTSRLRALGWTAGQQRSFDLRQRRCSGEEI